MKKEEAKVETKAADDEKGMFVQKENAHQEQNLVTQKVVDLKKEEAKVEAESSEDEEGMFD